MKPDPRPLHRRPNWRHGYAWMCNLHFPRPPHHSGLPAPSWGPFETGLSAIADFYAGAGAWLAAHKCEGRRFPDALRSQKLTPQTPLKKVRLGEST